MLAQINDRIDRLLAPVPGLLLICAGMLMVGAAVLMPPWLEAREMAWKLRLMHAQAAKLDDEAQGYRDFNAALAADDPVLLERLAFYNLHLKPVGAMPLAPQSGVSNASLRTGSRTPAAPITPISSPTIDQMLHQALPRPGIDTPRYEAIKTRLVTLTTGPMRFAVIAAGLICLGAGLIAPNPRKKEVSRPRRVFEPTGFVPAVLDEVDDDFTAAVP